MLADKTDTRIESTITGTKIAMSLDENSLAHLMKVMTDLYSDPEKAIIREYSTNALDAQIEAGVTEPIQVTLPSNLAPYLTIRDFGIGLDLDGIQNIYSKYGASTKRDTNDQVGMLGLGCKSALTYTDQFTLIGVKDGIRSQVVVSRDEFGAGSMTVISEEETDERNGVTVQIPVKKVNQIEKKTYEFFQFWQPGTVLVNGEEPPKIEGISVTDNITIMKGWDQSYVVMGGVPYPADLYHGLNNCALVCNVAIGDINFTPSREALQHTSKTKATLERVQNEFRDNVEGAIQKTIDKCKTAQEAMRLANDWRSILSRVSVKFTYNGHEIPAFYNCPMTPMLDDKGKPQKDPKGMPLMTPVRFVVSPANSTVLSRHSTERRIEANWVADGLYVTDYDLKFTAAHKKKLLKYAKDNDLKVRYFILDTTLPEGMEWIDPERVVSYDVIKDIKLDITRHNRFAGRLRGSYEVAEGNRTLTNVEAEDLRMMPTIFYYCINGNTFSRDREYDARELADRYFPGCVVVMLPVNREAKFRRDFPQARYLKTALREKQSEFYSTISDERYLAHSLKQKLGFHHRECLSKLDATKIKDPEIVQAIELSRMDAKEVADPFKRVLPYHVDRPEWVNPTKDYPLWDWSVVRYQPDHIILYVNATYRLAKKARRAQRKKGKKS